MDKNLIFKCGDRIIRHGDETMVCGIVNVTPDSFSDGGDYNKLDEAVARALKMEKEGAGMVDIGGESTRPGSTYVDIEEEIARVVPVIKRIRQESDILISVDTWKSQVAQAALDAGAHIVNDITGLVGDPAMASLIKDKDASAILMFNPVLIRPGNDSSKKFPKFGGEGVFSQEEIALAESSTNIVQLMKMYFEKSLEIARSAGLEDSRLMLDPGIGFALSKKETLLLLANLSVIHQMGFTAYLGVSRKRFLVNLLEEAGIEVDPKTAQGYKNRDIASAILTALAARQGIEAVRVHSIEEHKIAQVVADSIRLCDLADDMDYDKYSR